MLRRWAPLVVVGALLSGSAAFVISKVTPAEYRATAQLFLTPGSNPSVAFQDVVLGQNLGRSYVQLATADVVLSPAMSKVGWADATSFRERTQVAQFRDTSVITVSFRDVDPVRAANAANAIASSFIDRTRELQTSLQGSTSNQVEDQIASVQRDIRSLDAQINALASEVNATARPGQPSSIPRPDQQAQLAQLYNLRQGQQQTLAQLLKTRDDMVLAATRAQNSVSLWQTAEPPTEPESPRVALNTMVGFLAGAIVMLLMSSVLGYLDDRLNDVSEMTVRLGIPGLAQVHLGENPDTPSGKLFVRDQPRSPEAEAFRALRTNVLFANVDKRPNSILVTSARAGEGKSVVSANLALAFAEAGAQVYLIDGDLRRPSQHRLFRVPSTSGLTSLLTGSSAYSAIEQFRVQPNITVIPSGPLPPNPAELLSSARMSALIDELVARPHAVVIIDSSPVLAVADPVALSTKVDGCLVVVDAEHTHTGAARHAVASIQAVHGTVLGGVLNKVSEKHAYYYYDYNYGSSGKSSRAARKPEAGKASPR